MGEYGFEVNLPELEVSASAWIIQHSKTSGSFALSFRGSGFSNFISHDSSEEKLAEALGSLEPINNDVKVSDKMEITDEEGKFGVA